MCAVCFIQHPLLDAAGQDWIQKFFFTCLSV